MKTRIIVVAAVAIALAAPALLAHMTIVEVLPGDGYTFETRREGARIVAITWKREIPPRQSAEFIFIARNPKSPQVVRRAHQHYADGTRADWTGVAGDRRPAAIMKLSAGKIIP
jgi:hypothetical protein